MAYVNQTDVLTLISATELTPFLDDDGDGVADSGLLDTIIAMASNAANSYVASVYATPFSTPPAKIKDATLIFVCEALYARRLAPEEKNPFKSRAEMWRKLLEDIGAGKQPLDQSFTKGFVPGVAVTYNSILSVDDQNQPLSLM